MLVFALSLAMVVTLVTATPVTLHNESQRARVKVTANRSRLMR